MRWTPELRDALAAEYVLGTQTRRIRRRLERLIDEDPELHERVAWWQERLQHLGSAVDPVPVPPWVWRRIEAVLQPEPESRESWWQNLFLWRGAAVAAAALALVLAVKPPPEPVMVTPEGGVVLVLTDPEAKTAWLVSRQSEEAPLVAQPVQLPVLTVQQAYELWLLPGGEAAPISMGLLSDNRPTELVLPAAVDALLQPGLTLAVSIEPAGGSPTGAPTGPVVFTGSVKSL